MPGRHKFALGLTQDALGSIVTRDEWHSERNEGYEESVSPGPAMGPLVKKAVERMVK